jgi:hypothetical protein
MNLDSIQKAQKRTTNTVSGQMECQLIFRNHLKYEVTEIMLAKLHSAVTEILVYKLLLSPVAKIRINGISSN